MKNGSRVIASKEFDNSGEGMKGKGQLLLPQGKFQEVLMGRLAKSGQAEVRLGWSVQGFEQVDGHVSVRLRAASVSSPDLPYEEPDSMTKSKAEDEDETIDAIYLIGADGAHSLVRKAMGLELKGETLDAQLVATDLKFPFKDHDFFDANFIVDSQNYGLIDRIDNEGLWRVSYGAPGSQSEEKIRGNVHEKLRGMLPNGGRNEEGRDGFEIVRVAPYGAQQRCASTLVEGRVLLVGDAAHCKYRQPAIQRQHRRTSNPHQSNQPLRRPWPRIRHRRRRLPRPHPRACSNRQSVFALHTPKFVVRSPTTEVLRCGRQTESRRL